MKRVFEKMYNKLIFYLYYKHTKRHKKELLEIYNRAKRHPRDLNFFWRIKMKIPTKVKM